MGAGTQETLEKGQEKRPGAKSGRPREGMAKMADLYGNEKLGEEKPSPWRFSIGGRVGSAARSHEAVSEFLRDLTSNRPSNVWAGRGFRL